MDTYEPEILGLNLTNKLEILDLKLTIGPKIYKLNLSPVHKIKPNSRIEDEPESSVCLFNSSVICNILSLGI